jgi:hypothetical protein
MIRRGRLRRRSGRAFELDGEAAGWARLFADGSGLRDMLRAARDKFAAALGPAAPQPFVVYIDDLKELYTRAAPFVSSDFQSAYATLARRPGPSARRAAPHGGDAGGMRSALCRCRGRVG